LILTDGENVNGWSGRNYYDYWLEKPEVKHHLHRNSPGGDGGDITAKYTQYLVETALSELTPNSLLMPSENLWKLKRKNDQKSRYSTAVSGIISLIIGGLAIFVLGTESWVSIIIELVVTGLVFIIAYNVLPYTTSELANVDALVRRATMVNEAKEDIADIQKIQRAYIKVPEVFDPINKILNSVSRTLSDVTRPGQNNDSKLVILHATLDDFDKYFYFIYQVESGDIPIDGAKKEIRDFRESLVETANEFENLRKSVNAQEAASGRARGEALK
jgi:hypothetical protein